MFHQHNSSPRPHSGHGNANVKVVVRVRPVNESEQSEKYHIVTEAISDHMLVFDPKIQNTSGFLLMSQRDINRRRFKDLKYAFDYVFGASASNRDVFEQTTKGIVSGVLNGYNCSVFAYGATGAGKTHTMLGNDKEPGVIYYTMIDLYRRINDQKDEKMFDVAVSYSEVYNEQVRDLLVPRGNLPIREDKNVGVIIAGLSLHKPKTADELLYMLQFGNKNRTQHPTDANAESSRSHAVFQVFVNQREKSASVSTEVRMAKMCLVDLAGSERANHSTNCGARFREGANINRSLLALGNVINALADNKFKGHIPYRDSKLTRLLKDSLGGNCQTVMIAAVSPSSRSFEDTYNTLRYADRAKHIRADLKKNVMSVDFHIANYKKYVKELEKENQDLRKAKQKLMDTLENIGTAAAPAVSPILRQFQERLKDLFKKHKIIRKTQMESEGAKRELKWKVARKEQSIKRVQHLTGSPNVIGKHKRIIERMKRRILKEEQALKDSSRSIQEHDNAILNTYMEISSTLSNSKESLELLELNVRIHTVEASLYDSHMYLAFVKKMARAQERQASVNEKLISCLIQLVKKQHDILHSQDLLNNELKSKYDQCCFLVEERGVAWSSPLAEQDRSSSKHTWDDNEDFCISDIIDIQIPKLHMQVFQGDTTPSKGKDNCMNQPPQRVLKPTSAVKPAARVMSGQLQYFNVGTSDTSARKGLSPSCYTAESWEFSNSQYAGGESLSERESTATCGDPGANAVEILNESLEMCPKRRGINTGKTGNSPQFLVSPSGISFGADELLKARSTEQDVASSVKVREENDNLCPSTSIEWGMPAGLRKTLSHHLAMSVAKHDFQTLPEEEDNSGKADVNDTFLIQRPSAVLSNIPSIESSRRCLFSSSITQSQNASVPRSSTSLPTTRRQSLERITNPQKPDLLTDGKCEGSVANNPVSRYPLKMQSFNHATAAWSPAVKVGYREDRATNIRRPSVESLIRQQQNKTKPISHNQNKIMRSPSPAMSGKLSMNPNCGHLNSPSSTGCDERQKSDSAFCANSNNVNTFALSATSPKSYADAVKSPAVTRMNPLADTKSRPTAVIRHWSNEQSESVMRTPDFGSGQCSTLVDSVVKKPFAALVLPFKAAEEGLREMRPPLRVLNPNTIRCPPDKLSSTSDQCSSESSGYEINKSQLKVRPNVARLRQNRAALTGPYNIQNHRQQRHTSSQEAPAAENSEATGISRPNYMQPTFARSQKTVGVSRERSFLLKSRNPAVQRPVTNRQPFAFCWNKTTTVSDAT
ncbi:hypothetical protein BsWGS_07152 [Bradybaena similaris]